MLPQLRHVPNDKDLGNLILQAVVENSCAFTRSIGHDLGISNSTVHKYLNCAQIQVVQQLRPHDHDRHLDFYRFIIDKSQDFIHSILFSDESHFSTDGVGNRHNNHVWEKKILMLSEKEISISSICECMGWYCSSHYWFIHLQRKLERG